MLDVPLAIDLDYHFKDFVLKDLSKILVMYRLYRLYSAYLIEVC